MTTPLKTARREVALDAGNPGRLPTTRDSPNPGQNTAVVDIDANDD
ncbi:hypothetical protein [Halorubellus litoreus]|uniref:Uncharacterized protein n=1 Tax=Halorubellus litoreus TaxID=755308 RepID=A0ABD5VNC1_9EURY